MIIRNLISAFILGLITAGCQLPLVIDTPPPVAPTSEPPTLEPSPTASAQPQTTPIPSPTTVVGLPPTARPTETPSPAPEILPYILQPGAPIALPNFARPDLGCFWMGVAGQVFNAEGEVVTSVVVELGGELAGIVMSDLKVAGGSKEYGPGGFEFTLAQRPLGSEKTLYVQLFDLSGKALSERIYFSTYNDCQRNLILLNFLEVPVEELPEPPTAVPTPETFEAYLPMVAKP